MYMSLLFALPIHAHSKVSYLEEKKLETYNDNPHTLNSSNVVEAPLLYDVFSHKQHINHVHTKNNHVNRKRSCLLIGQVLCILAWVATLV